MMAISFLLLVGGDVVPPYLSCNCYSSWRKKKNNYKREEKKKTDTASSNPNHCMSIPRMTSWIDGESPNKRDRSSDYRRQDLKTTIISEGIQSWSSQRIRIRAYETKRIAVERTEWMHRTARSVSSPVRHHLGEAGVGVLLVRLRVGSLSPSIGFFSGLEVTAPAASRFMRSESSRNWKWIGRNTPTWPSDTTISVEPAVTLDVGFAGQVSESESATASRLML